MASLTPSDLIPFLALARHRSFRRAAHELGCTPSALSHAMKGMESRLGLRLFNRTTRSVALTEAGERLLARVAPAWQDIQTTLEELDAFRGEPSGRLRINAARTAARMLLLPAVARFLRAHPRITVEIAVENRMVDMVGEGFDAGVRFGEVIARDMIAVPLGPRQRTAIVAAPEVIARHGRPLLPDDLRRMPCIGLRFGSGRLYAWEFERDRQELSVEVTGPLVLDDQDMMPDAALEGLGFAYAFEDQVAPLLAEGRLVRVLEDWCPPYAGMFLYYPSRRQVPPALRAFLDFIRG